MKNLVLILGIMTLVAFAENQKGGGGGDKGGRGVGGGYGQIRDLFSSVAMDADTVAANFDTEMPSSSWEFISGNSSEAIQIDTQKIIDFIGNDNIFLVDEGSVFVPQGVSYTISDGKLYLNQRMWDERSKRPEGIEVDILHVLLFATDQEDPAGAVSKFYGEKIRTLNGIKTLELELDSFSTTL